MFVKQLVAYRFRTASIALAEFATNNTQCCFAERKFPTALHLVIFIKIVDLYCYL